MKSIVDIELPPVWPWKKEVTQASTWHTSMGPLHACIIIHQYRHGLLRPVWTWERTEAGRWEVSRIGRPKHLKYGVILLHHIRPRALFSSFLSPSLRLLPSARHYHACSFVLRHLNTIVVFLTYTDFNTLSQPHSLLPQSRHSRKTLFVDNTFNSFA